MYYKIFIDNLDKMFVLYSRPKRFYVQQSNVVPQTCIRWWDSTSEDLVNVPITFWSTLIQNGGSWLGHIQMDLFEN